MNSGMINTNIPKMPSLLFQYKVTTTVLSGKRNQGVYGDSDVWRNKETHTEFT
jgi:hypothetical protein